jgi:hypothetical protein
VIPPWGLSIPDAITWQVVQERATCIPHAHVVQDAPQGSFHNRHEEVPRFRRLSVPLVRLGVRRFYQEFRPWYQLFHEPPMSCIIALRLGRYQNLWRRALLLGRYRRSASGPPPFLRRPLFCLSQRPVNMPGVAQGHPQEREHGIDLVNEPGWQGVFMALCMAKSPLLHRNMTAVRFRLAASAR